MTPASVVSAQKAEIPETVQDVLKTKYNITLPDIETPEFLQNLTLFSSGNDTARRGIMARQRGLRPKHPVVIIPGVRFASAPIIVTYANWSSAP